MPASNLTTPLTEADLDRLDLLLGRVNSDAMTMDELDGFFCALVCGPAMDPVSSYFPDVLGQDQDDNAVYSLVDPEELSTLLYRYWNQIAASMMAGEHYVPQLSFEDSENPDGLAWARGFVQGMNLDPEGWDRVTKDRNNWTLVAPMMLLLANADPGLAPELTRPLDTPEKRMDVLLAATASLSLIFKHFHPKSAKSGSKRK
jgi:uncharacterized protein